MVDENYSNFTRTGQTRVVISLMSPKITEKRGKRERERERKREYVYIWKEK